MNLPRQGRKAAVAEWGCALAARALANREDEAETVAEGSTISHPPHAHETFSSTPARGLASETMAVV